MYVSLKRRHHKFAYSDPIQGKSWLIIRIIIWVAITYRLILLYLMITFARTSVLLKGRPSLTSLFGINLRQVLINRRCYLLLKKGSHRLPADSGEGYGFSWLINVGISRGGRRHQLTYSEQFKTSLG